MSYHFLDFELDPTRYQLRRAGTEIPLPPRIFDLVLLLIRHRDSPVSKAEILSTVWRGRTVTEASLTHAIARARKALGDTPSEQSIIKTVHGRGYWWVVETREVGGLSVTVNTAALPLVGRESELSAISRVFDETGAAKGSLVLLLGEPGVGKTRLSDECAARAVERGFRVLTAACLEHEGAPPGLPWVLVLQRCIANLERTRRAAEVSDAIRHLTGVFPELDGHRPTHISSSLSRASEAFSIFESIWSVLSWSAIGAPHLIVIDDLHRADGLSLTILRLLVRRLGHDRLAVIGCARESAHGPGNAPESLAELVRQPRVQAIALGPLLRSDLPRLVEQANLGSSADVCDALFERSGGNPFFLTHLIASLLRSRGSASSSEIRDLSRLPLSVRDAILRLLRNVPEESIEILELGAVVGRSFSPLLLADVAGLPTGEILDALQICERLGLVEEDPHSPGGLRFRHVIVRDVIYQGLARLKRGSIHKRIACSRAYVSGISAAAVAHHMRCAFPLAEPDEVARSTIRAAHQASSRSAFVEVVHECRSALSLSGLEESLSPAVRCELLLTEAAGRLRAGEREQGRQDLFRAAELARSQGLVAQLADAALAIAPGFFAIETGVVDVDLIETLEQALAMLPEEDSIVRVRLLGNLAAALYWSSEQRRIPAILGEGAAIAERMASREARAYALAARFIGRWSPASLEERVDSAEDLIDLADETGDHDLRLMSRVFRTSTFLERGAFASARTEIKRLEAISRTTRHPHGQFYVPMYRAMLEINRGRFEQARPHMAKFVELGTRVDDANVSQTFLLQSAEIAWQSGCPEPILAAVESNVLENPTLKEWECAQAFLLARAGHQGAARQLAARLIAEIDDEVLARMNVAIALGALAEACWLLDDPELASMLEPWISGIGARVIVAGYGILCWGSSSRGIGHVAATLERWDEAEARYSEALRMEESVGAVPWFARTNAAFGRALERRGRMGDKARGEQMRAYGEALARQLGLSCLGPVAA